MISVSPAIKRRVCATLCGPAPRCLIKTATQLPCAQTQAFGPGFQAAVAFQRARLDQRQPRNDYAEVPDQAAEMVNFPDGNADTAESPAPVRGGTGDKAANWLSCGVRAGQTGRQGSARCCTHR